MGGSYYRHQLEDFLKTLDVKADLVLDVGGGQKSIKGRTKSWDVKECQVLDLPEYDLNLPFAYPRQANVLFCLEVFEYLINPVVGMQNIANLLKKDGRAIITFAFVYPFHNEIEFDSLRYTETGVKRLTELVGLKVDKMTKRKTKTDTLVRYYQEDGMKMAKHQDHNVTGFILEAIK